MQGLESCANSSGMGGSDQEGTGRGWCGQECRALNTPARAVPNGEVVALRDVIDDWQIEDFQASDGGWLRITGCDPSADGKQRIWSERPRGHSKTTDLAISVTWALFAGRRRIGGVVAAADRDQASLLRNAIEVLLRINPWLADFLDVQRWQVVNKHTDSVMTIISSDAGSSYGLLPDFIVVDEIVHWSNRDLWDSLFSASAKRRHCVLACVTNAGFTDSWQHDVREQIREDTRWHFSRLDGPVSSWITEADLEEQRSVLPAPLYERLWMNQWTGGSGDALTAVDIEAAITMNGEPGREKNIVYCGGVDLSVSRDKSAFAILGINRSTGRMKLVHVRTWEPRDGKVDLIDIVDHIRSQSKIYRLKLVLSDPWQAELMIQQLRKDLVIEDEKFTGQALNEMASQLLEAIAGQQIDLYPHAQLIRDLRRLRIEESRQGFRLKADRTADGHCDAATAFTLALMACRRIMPKSGPKKLNRSLLLLAEEELALEPQWMNDDDPWGDADRPYQWSPGLAEWRRFS